MFTVDSKYIKNWKRENLMNKMARDGEKKLKIK